MDLTTLLAALFGPPPSEPQGVGTVLQRGTIPYAMPPQTMPVMGRGQLDMQLAAQPGRIMRPNPFGMGPDFNDAPRLVDGSASEIWYSLNPPRFGPDEDAIGSVPYNTAPYGIRR